MAYAETSDALALSATLVSSDAEFTCVPGLQVKNWL